MPSTESHIGLTPAEHADALSALVKDGPEVKDIAVTDVLVYDDEGNPEVLQVEEDSGQQRMHFLGMNS